MPLNALQADCKSAKLKSISSLFILCVNICFNLSLKTLRKCCIAVMSCFADMNSAMGNGPTFFYITEYNECIIIDCCGRIQFFRLRNDRSSCIQINMSHLI